MIAWMWPSLHFSNIKFMGFFLHWSFFQSQTSVLFIQSWMLMNVKRRAFLSNCVFLNFLVASISHFTTLTFFWRSVSFLICGVKGNHSAVHERAEHRRHVELIPLVDSCCFRMFLPANPRISPCNLVKDRTMTRQQENKKTIVDFCAILSCSNKCIQNTALQKRKKSVSCQNGTISQFVSMEEDFKKTASSLFVKSFTGAKGNY